MMYSYYIDIMMRARGHWRRWRRIIFGDENIVVSLPSVTVDKQWLNWNYPTFSAVPLPAGRHPRVRRKLCVERFPWPQTLVVIRAKRHGHDVNNYNLSFTISSLLAIGPFRGQNRRNGSFCNPGDWGFINFFFLFIERRKNTARKRHGPTPTAEDTRSVSIFSGEYIFLFPHWPLLVTWDRYYLCITHKKTDGIRCWINHTATDHLGNYVQRMSIIRMNWVHSWKGLPACLKMFYLTPYLSELKRCVWSFDGGNYLRRHIDCVKCGLCMRCYINHQVVAVVSSGW